MINHWQRDLLRVSLLLIVCVLGGCFEVQQKLTVDASGEAELMLTVAMDEEIAGMADGDDELAQCETDFGFEDDLPPTLSKTSRVRTQDDDVLCDVIVSGPLVDMIPVMEAYTAEQSDNDFVLIQDLGNGRFALVGQYDFSDDRMDLELDGAAAGGLERAIRGAVSASLDGAVISWEVRAPNIVEHNGEQQGDGSVTWSFPLSEAVTRGGVYTFEVIFETQAQPQFF